MWGKHLTWSKRYLKVKIKRFVALINWVFFFFPSYYSWGLFTDWDNGWTWLQDYKKFWENFGRFVKLGCIEDSGNHKRITPLLRFYSSKNEEELTSLDEYVENMGENQNAIYYLATDSLKSAKSAPFLEKLLQKDIEVCQYVFCKTAQFLDILIQLFPYSKCLNWCNFPNPIGMLLLCFLWISPFIYWSTRLLFFLLWNFVGIMANIVIFSQVLYLIEPIDEVAIQNLQTYKEKKFVDISKEDLELGLCSFLDLFIIFGWGVLIMVSKFKNFVASFFFSSLCTPFSMGEFINWNTRWWGWG